MFLAAWLQDRSLKKRDQQALKGERLAAIALTVAAAERVRLAGKTLRGDAWEIALASAPGAIATAMRTVESFPAYRLGDEEGIVEFSRVVAILELAHQESLEAIDDLDDAGHDPRRVARDCAKILHAHAKLLDGKARLMRERYGFPAPPAREKKPKTKLKPGETLSPEAELEEAAGEVEPLS